jgi:hypothetical protein
MLTTLGVLCIFLIGIVASAIADDAGCLGQLFATVACAIIAVLVILVVESLVPPSPPPISVCGKVVKAESYRSGWSSASRALLAVSTASGTVVQMDNPGLYEVGMLVCGEVSK